jgi:hypothetical protein
MIGRRHSRNFYKAIAYEIKHPKGRERIRMKNHISSELGFLGENIKIVVDAINNRDQVDMKLLIEEVEKNSDGDEDLVIESMKYLTNDKRKADLSLAL